MKMKHVMASTLVGVSLLSPLAVAADSQVQKVIDENYVQPDYVLGYSLDENQKAKTLNYLSYDANKDTKEVKTMTPEVYASIMNTASDDSLQLYSSVKIEKMGSNKPLEVKIVTPENITKVTQDMYRNAAVTLGIEHASISVAAPLPVTGESALAGIYYSLEKNGVQLPQENKNLAQEELSTLATISDENSGKEGFDTNKLNVALADIKSQIAQLKEKNGSLTEEEVRKIVEDTLANYELNQVVTSEQVTLIVNFAINLSNSGVITDEDFVKNLASLKDSIVAQAGDSFKGINLDFNSAETQNILAQIWQAIVDFFKGLIK